MLETWRWFGPDDPVSLENVREAGAVGVVSALHHMNQGQVWSEDEVLKRRSEIEGAGLVWSVSESIGVGEEIKTRSVGYRAKIDNYKQSIRNAARAGVKTFCYNFMAITDWTRTESQLAASERRNGFALRRDRLRGLRPLHPETRRRRGRLRPEAHRRGAGALRKDVGGGNGGARAHAHRLAARARLHLRPAELQARAGGL